MVLGLIAAGSNRPVSGSSWDEPKAVVPDDPIYLFLNAPNDLDAFWKLIGRPDRVVLDGELYRKLRKASEASRPTDSRAPALVEAVAVKGRVNCDWAFLSLEIQATLEGDGPDWMPIRLDGLTLTEAIEAGKDLPTRIVEDRGWEVELRGKGPHRIAISLIAPVKSTVDGKRLEMLITPAAATGIDLVVQPIVLDASTGINEKLAIGPAEANTTGSRLQARLSPRSKLEISWRERSDPAAKLPPLLEANGDIALEIDRDSIQTRSTWVVRSIRGTVGQITLQLDSAEEVLDVLVDDRPVVVETRREGDRSAIVIPLTEPLRTESSRALTLSTRRTIASEGTVRAVIEGYSFDQAKIQSGMIAISRSGSLFLNPTTTRGLRRIDPRTELPDSLRNRADTVLAFKFNGSPFELGLSIEPAPPRLRIDERTTVTIDPQSARIQTRLDCRISQGPIFDVQVILPKGLDFDWPGPPEVVSSVQVVSLDSRATLGVDVPRILSIGLMPQAREGDSFPLVLKGWAAIDPSKPVSVPLFRPVVDSSHGGQFAIVSSRNVSVDLAPIDDEPSPFRVDWGQPPTDWVWPVRKPGPEQNLLWLRTDSDPERLTLKATVRPRTVSHESLLNATIDRRGAEVSEEITGEVAYGSLAKLDVAIPREVGDRWEVEGLDRVIQEPLETEADGSRRYRLKFPREFTDTFRLKIRYRLPFPRPAADQAASRLTLAPIRILEGTSTGRRVTIAADSGIDVQAEAPGWSATSPLDPAGSTESDPPVRISLSRNRDSAGPVVVVIQPGPKTPLPPVLISRLWIKTTQRLDGDLTTSAYFWVETRESSFVFGLEPGSRLVRARVGSAEMGEGSIESINHDEYRLRFPTTTPSGPILVAIDWTTPASATRNGWPAPRLLGDGVIQQTVWEAQLVGTRAGVGTPSGWLDENDWYWDWRSLIWQRRPWKNSLELANWLTCGNTRYRLTESIELDDRGNRHSYLFSRVGPPPSLRFLVFSRFTLLLLCSGPVLLAGLLVLVRRPPLRLTSAAGLIVIFAIIALVESDVLILVVQSSLIGVGLFLIALLIQWVMERRNPSRAIGDLGSMMPAPTTGSTFQRAPSIGSDDSTAIRVRPVVPPPATLSTADQIILTRNLGRPPDERSTSELDLR